MEKIWVRVHPSARRTAIVGLQNDVLRIDLSSPPVDNRANEELVRLLARELGIARSQVAVLRGQTSRQKLVSIDARAEDVATWLATLRSREHSSDPKRGSAE